MKDQRETHLQPRDLLCYGHMDLLKTFKLDSESFLQDLQH